jgi:hypothetical protein
MGRASCCRFLREIRVKGSLPDTGLYAFEVLVVVGGVALLVLFSRRLRGILSAQADLQRRNAHRRAHRPRLAAAGTEIAEAEVVLPLEAWPAY